MADPSKFLNSQICFRSKAPNPQDWAEDNYLRNIWNLYRPYVRCRCWIIKGANCKANIMWFDHLIWFMLFNAHTFFPLSSSKASLAACITWFSNLLAEVKQAVLVYYIIHPSMIDKAKNSLDPSFILPPIMDNTPLNTLVSSLFNPDKSNSITTPAAKKSKSSSTPFNS